MTAVVMSSRLRVLMSGIASNNTKTDSHNDNRVKNDSHNDNRIYTKNDSHNDSSTKVFTITATVSNQDLSGTVTDNSATLGGSESIPAQTGAITGNTYTSFAGIQTANNNTGLNSLGQAATSIAANANVTFGTP